MRIFLRLLVEPGLPELDLDQVGWSIFSGRKSLDSTGIIKTADLTNEELLTYRTKAQVIWSDQAGGPSFRKVHDAYRDQFGRVQFSPIATRLAICIVRNPLDIASSLSNHYGLPVQHGVDQLNQTAGGVMIKTPNARSQLPQYYGDWSAHTTSWLDQTDLPVLLIRYEDMKRKPFETFAAVAHRSGIAASSNDILKAIEGSSFQRLKALEEQQGFSEKPPHAQSFFRAGKVGGWRDELNEEQVHSIIRQHHSTMQRLGYLDQTGEPL